MAVSVASHHQLLRDLSRAYVLLVGAAFTAFLLIYLSCYWSSPTHHAREAGALADDASAATRYTGSIMIDPPRGELCWERIFDNRTGRMWDNGYVKCETKQAQLADDNQRVGMDVWRLHEVGKAFRH